MRHAHLGVKALAIVAFAAVLSGCGGGGNPTVTNSAIQTSSSPAGTSSTVTSTAPQSSAAEPAAPPPKTSESQAKVGSGEVTYDDGLTITVPKVEPFKPSDTAAGQEAGNEALLVTVSIKNGTGKPFDASLASVNLNAGEQGESASAITDLEKNVGMGFTSTIAAGKTATAKFAFSVPKGTKTFDVAVTPDFNHDDALFTGTL